MWDPFNLWGRPEDYGVRQIGELNPLIYFTLLLNQAGFSFALSFFIFQVFYFFLGLIGFYLLSLRIFQNKALAYLAMILLMFTTMGSNLFNDIHVINVLVPSIWFFYFLIGFSQHKKTVHLLGLTCSASILIVTFIPFYFLTVLLMVLVGFGLLYSGSLKTIMRGYADFLINHKRVSLFCFLTIALALIPPLMFYLHGQSGEYVYSWRNTGGGSGAMGLSRQAINQSSIAGAFWLTGLFSYLDNLHAGSIFIPIFAFLVGVLGMVTRPTKLLILSLSIFVSLVLISLGDVTPVHGFLFDHIAFFQKFRNLHFLLWLSLPFFILFIVEQFRLLQA
jgi:hypothetical protein